MTVSSWTLHVLLTLPSLVAAYSWQFDGNPTQCGTVKISIVGSGTPPYRLSIVPFGGTPLGNSREVRRVMDLPFNDSSSITFQLPYPTNSQFVATVSDHNGSASSFGNGGVTVPVNVQAGNAGDGCLPQSVSPAFTFSSDPLASLTTCETTLLNWDGSQSQGDVTFWAIIPGGDAFVIPKGPQTTASNGHPAVPWTPPINPGVNVLVVAGDNRGFGTGGSFQVAMQPGNGTVSCINNDSPKSTPGTPAGGSYPTNQNGDLSAGGGGGTNVGAIVGGVVGGIAFVAILGIILFFLLRRRRSRRVHNQPVDLLDGQHTQEVAGEEYLPQPYSIPERSRTSHEMTEADGFLAASMPDRERRQSGLSTSSGYLRSETPSSSMPTRTNKSATGPPTLRPVNIIQHEDAGPSEGAKEEPETVELPPAYTNLKTK